MNTSNIHSVLFLCTGNSCRSQMAEGFARSLCGSTLKASSAGTAPKAIDPMAIEVMAELGIDISGQGSTQFDDVDLDTIDTVVTVCDNATQQCPLVPGGVRVVHHAFDDPPHLAKSLALVEEKKEVYRRVRDEIRELVISLCGAA